MNMDTSILSQIASEIQAFAGADVLTVGTLAILEGILSVDNSKNGLDGGSFG